MACGVWRVWRVACVACVACGGGGEGQKMYLSGLLPGGSKSRCIHPPPPPPPPLERSTVTPSRRTSSNSSPPPPTLIWPCLVCIPPLNAGVALAWDKASGANANAGGPAWYRSSSAHSAATAVLELPGVMASAWQP